MVIDVMLVGYTVLRGDDGCTEGDVVMGVMMAVGVTARGGDACGCEDGSAGGGVVNVLVAQSDCMDDPLTGWSC